MICDKLGPENNRSKEGVYKEGGWPEERDCVLVNVYKCNFNLIALLFLRHFRCFITVLCLVLCILS